MVSVNKMTTDLPTQPTNNVAPNINVEDRDVELSKQIRKPSQKVADLLEGKAQWSTNAKGMILPPGIQGPSDDWTAETTEYKDEYIFLAEVSNLEALEPRNIMEAKARPDWNLWERAIKEELRTLREARTWEVVDKPKNANVVGSKWVFRAKKDAAGNVVRYKARLVAQGFSQVPGIDYFDTFALVAQLASIQTVLAFAAAEDYKTGQIDIKAAYLNGELTSD